MSLEIHRIFENKTGIGLYVFGVAIPLSFALKQLWVISGIGMLLVLVFVLYQFLLNFFRVNKVWVYGELRYYLSYAVILIGSLIMTRAANYGFEKFVLYVFYYVMLGYSLLCSVNKYSDVADFIGGFLVGSVLLLLISLMVIGNPVFLFGVMNKFDRLSLGDESNPIIWAQFLGIGGVLFFDKMRTANKFYHRFVFLVFVLLCLLYMFLSGSKGPLIAYVVSVCVLMVEKKSDFAVVVFISVMALLAYEYILLQNIPIDFVLQRYSGENLGSFDTRYETYNIAVDGYLKSDLFGILFGNGVGDFSVLHYGRDMRDYPHNIFIESLYETGFIGALNYVLCIMYPIVKYLKGRVKIKSLKLKDNHSLQILLSCYLFVVVSAQFTGDIGSNWMISVFGFILIGAINKLMVGKELAPTSIDNLI